MIIKDLIEDRERECVCVSCVFYDHNNMIEDRERECVCVCHVFFMIITNMIVRNIYLWGGTFTELFFPIVRRRLFIGRTNRMSAVVSQNATSP